MTPRTYFVVIAALALSVPVPVYGQKRIITGPVSDQRMVTLGGNTRREATRVNDRGALPADFRLDHMHLQLKRLPDDERAVQKAIDELSTPDSANYRKWMTAAEYGSRFGLSPDDTDQLTNWLASKGFIIHGVSPSRMAIDFSGTTGQVRTAFHTEIHRLDVAGESHMANMSDPQVPDAFAHAIAGIVGLNDFRPVPLIIPRKSYFITSGLNAIVPADLALIYNLNPAFAAGYTGAGQTIAVLEDSDLFSATDWAAFRKTMGLTLKYSKGTFSQVHPAPGTAGPCSDPGVTGDDGEATLDAEWASAAAPNAVIVLESCANTSTNAGIFIALENMLTNGTTPPSIISISYAASEALIGSGGNAYVNALYQLAAAEGISILAASGDWGADVSSAGSEGPSVSGINVNGLGSTPNNLAVGGTDFADLYIGATNAYWNTTNGPNYVSAKSYVLEVPWNDSCAGTLVTAFVGFPTPYGASGFCNSSVAVTNGFVNNIAGSGGPSACGLGDSSGATPDVVSGTCAGYPKPSWQAGFAGIHNDGVRDLPDISLFASNGFLGHYYVVCFSDVAQGGASCLSTPSTWAGFGGTSVSTPIAAGIQALINQRTGSRQGNPAPAYYALAASQYGASGNPACNSTLGNAVSASCVFYDVTAGDMDIACHGAHNCFTPSGTFGVLSTSNSVYQPAYHATTGWDFATGIGTLNVFNLVMNWP